MVLSGHAGPIFPVFSVLGPTALILVFMEQVMNLVGTRGGLSDTMSLVVVALMVTAQYVAYFAVTRTHSRSAMRLVLIVHFGCVAMAYVAAKVF